MKHFTSQDRFAADIQVDDWFKQGGCLYRVKSVDVRHFEVQLVCYPVYNPEESMVLWVSKKQIFKIYNQK